MPTRFTSVKLFALMYFAIEAIVEIAVLFITEELNANKIVVFIVKTGAAAAATNKLTIVDTLGYPGAEAVMTSGYVLEATFAPTMPVIQPLELFNVRPAGKVVEVVKAIAWPTTLKLAKASAATLSPYASPAWASIRLESINASTRTIVGAPRTLNVVDPV